MSRIDDKNLDDVYLFHLEKAYKLFKKYKKNFFKDEGVDLTSDQWIVLKRISDEEGISQKEIADKSFKEPASVTRILDILQGKGLIYRKEAKEDRRAYGLFLTDEGLTLVKKLIPKAKKARAFGVQGLSEEEVLNLNKYLKKICENFA
ncbi:MAG: MarR family transcriptional regulator [Bacteroidia bacterium]|nr:MarR family transcriptional regulator [Bacteroidia bacterium]